jgi:hypothetical protein
MASSQETIMRRTQVAGRLGLSCRCAAANSYVKKLSAVSQMRVEGCVTRQTEKGAVTK